MQRLKDQIAVVTGASRAAGQAIASVLGEDGATVYVTGRSIRGKSTSTFQGDSIDDTAEMVTRRGGKGIPVQVDHSQDEQVKALFERVQQEQGRLDILVNNAWGGYENYDDTFDAPFWKQPLSRWDKMLNIGLRSHLATTYFAVPLMLERRAGLIINTTTYFNPGSYHGSLFYDTVKTAIARMTFCMGEDLREHQVTALAIAPGWMRTKIIYDAFKTDENNWVNVPELANTESTTFVGRAIAALAVDPNVMQKTGQTITAWTLSQQYGFTDVDGRQPNFYGAMEAMGM